MKKVFILADNHAVGFISILPDRKVRRPSQTDVKHMLAVTASS